MRSPRSSPSFDRASTARALMAAGRRFYGRSWVMGTSGNMSAVLTRSPLRLLITRSGAHKGAMVSADFVTVDAEMSSVGRTTCRPSAEARLHLGLAQARGAGSVLHTHSVWGTVLSDVYARDGGVSLESYEMLKGLDGVTTHDHREWVPIVDNDQDMARVWAAFVRVFELHPRTHAILLRRHGLYTWGATVADAERHVEILEFLLEAHGRRLGLGGTPHGTDPHS